MPATMSLFAEVLPADCVVAGDAVSDDYAHDECLTVDAVAPAAVLFPTCTEEVSAILRVADQHRIPVTARGSGTGLSGSAVPRTGGVVVSFERMNQLLELDVDNQVAVVQPGITLAELDEHTAAAGLLYPVYPGEYSASLGGNVATNAGGMRAVKYGVTRQHVLGLEVVLAGGEVIRTGGKVMKSSTGYDLTQLFTGSEGTLGLTTEVTLRLQPRLPCRATVMAPFATLDQVTAAVPRVVASGLDPTILEYIDLLTLSATLDHVGLDLGIPDDIRQQALAYLVVSLEGRQQAWLDDDVEALGALLDGLGALDVYVLPDHAAVGLIEAREKAFFVAKANGADDIVDVVVPRASIADFMGKVADLAAAEGAWIAGCGHAGDGNVHLAVFQADSERRSRLLRALFEIGVGAGGVISGEHGIGLAKKAYYLALEDPVKVELQRRIKAAFDPHGILNPGNLFDPTDGVTAP
ncbi:MAG TPA: FAD-linked oxidase C-terminal domain-containing protein [Acidimicrobiales bacterium]|jgi:glycolate oxidase|nr:FAD-linked oxidase C-terminal domain-containing protein [Acidimicrobiales bacterium]